MKSMREPQEKFEIFFLKI